MLSMASRAAMPIYEMTNDECRMTKEARMSNDEIVFSCFVIPSVIGHSSFVIIFRTVIKIPASDFDLAKTLDSGQVFHWQKIDNGFVGVIGDCAVYVEQQEDVLRVKFGAGKLDRLNRSSFKSCHTIPQKGRSVRSIHSTDVRVGASA